jgi:membrane-bound ClpP family serine protease
MPTFVDAIKEKMAKVTESLEAAVNGDVVGVFGPIVGGVEHRVRLAIEKLPARRNKLAIVIRTGGGSIEVAERIVNTTRHFYPNEVVFVVPDVALSAGTVLAMSGDAILMDYFSALGPIDPQVESGGKLVPALSYLEQFDRMVVKSSQGTLTTAEIALLSKLDLAELHYFEQAKALTIDLLVAWLAKYKFKTWATTQTRGLAVTPAMREQRAREIAEALNNPQKWRVHGRGIPMRTLTDELNLVIDDFGADPGLSAAIKEYHEFVDNLMVKEGMESFVTSREYV